MLHRQILLNITPSFPINFTDPNRYWCLLSGLTFSNSKMRRFSPIFSFQQTLHFSAWLWHIIFLDFKSCNTL